jgi:regulator of nonsense transcripts 3
MASTTTPTKAQSTKARKEKKEKGQQPAPNDRLKTVVRRLPPNLPEDIFWQSVLPWVTESTITWKTYYPGKQKKRSVTAPIG